MIFFFFVYQISPAGVEVRFGLDHGHPRRDQHRRQQTHKHGHRPHQCPPLRNPHSFSTIVAGVIATAALIITVIIIIVI